MRRCVPLRCFVIARETRRGVVGGGTVGKKKHKRRKIAAAHKKESFKPRAHPSRSPAGGGGVGIRQRHRGTAVAILHPRPPRPFVTWPPPPPPPVPVVFSGHCVFRILTQTSVRARGADLSPGCITPFTHTRARALGIVRPEACHKFIGLSETPRGCYPYVYVLCTGYDSTGIDIIVITIFFFFYNVYTGGLQSVFSGALRFRTIVTRRLRIRINRRAQYAYDFSKVCFIANLVTCYLACLKYSNQTVITNSSFKTEDFDF